jgi:tRNA-5-methyluridine54 2-sulfurtransferase
MKCRKCSQVAVINMRQHKLALCEAHYLEWLPAQTQRTIEKYHMFTPEDKILVAVSGGKDSLSVWDILLKLGYQADGMTLQLGIDEGIGYSDQSHAYIEKFIHDFYPQAVLHTVDVKATYGASIPEIAARHDRAGERPCAVCGLIKRHEMNRIAYELGYNVLVTGHNLDDEASVLWGNLFHWQIEALARQSPVLPADRPGLARKVKPLCRFYERDMAAYALLRGIEYVYDECPFAVNASTLRNKATLNDMEQEQPGTKMQFYAGFLTARERGLFTLPGAEQRPLSNCLRCGQPTSTQRLCAFCKLWETT